MIPRNAVVPVALLVVLATGLAGCTRVRKFLNFGVAADDAPPALGPPLDQNELVARLSSLDLSLTATESGAAGKAFFLCKDEKRLRDQLAAKGGMVAADVEIDAAGCGGGLGAFTFRIACPSEPDGAPAGVASHELFHRQGFNFGGALEGRCLAQGQGKTRFSLAVTVTDTARSAKTQFTIDDGQGAPCGVARAADGAITVENCVYETRTEEGKSLVVVRASAKGLTGKPGERFYSGGVMDLAINDWYGEVHLTAGDKAPLAQMTNGKATITVNLKGAFTAPKP